MTGPLAPRGAAVCMFAVLAALAAVSLARGEEPAPTESERVQAILDERKDRWKADWAVRELKRNVDGGQRDPQVVGALVRSRYFLAKRWLKDEDSDATEELLKEAVKGGVAWMAGAMGADIEDFDDLDDKRGRVGRVHVPVYYWTTIAFGSVIPYTSVFGRMGSAKEFRRGLERLVELDGGYFYGGPHRVLAEFLAQAPGLVGGDEDDAKRHARKALELAPAYVENHIVHAIVVTRPEAGEDAYGRELRKAAALPLDALPDCVPEQTAARARAERLLRELGR